jgi:hypothetical protein
MSDNQYREKPVEAFQLTKERIDSNEEWPDWMLEAWNRERGDPCSLYVHYTEPRTLGVVTEHGPLIIEPGAWLLKNAEGGFYLLENDDFEKIYEKV